MITISCSSNKKSATFKATSSPFRQKLAKKIGITHSLVSDYETDRCMKKGEMVARFTLTLNVTADETLGLKPGKQYVGKNPSLKIMRRLDRMNSMLPAKQKAFLQIIDALRMVQVG